MKFYYADILEIISEYITYLHKRVNWKSWHHSTICDIQTLVLEFSFETGILHMNIRVH